MRRQSTVQCAVYSLQWAVLNVWPSEGGIWLVAGHLQETNTKLGSSRCSPQETGGETMEIDTG